MKSMATSIGMQSENKIYLTREIRQLTNYMSYKMKTEPNDWSPRTENICNSLCVWSQPTHKFCVNGTTRTIKFLFIRILFIERCQFQTESKWTSKYTKNNMHISFSHCHYTNTNTIKNGSTTRIHWFHLDGALVSNVAVEIELNKMICSLKTEQLNYKSMYLFATGSNMSSKEKSHQNDRGNETVNGEFIINMIFSFATQNRIIRMPTEPADFLWLFRWNLCCLSNNFLLPLYFRWFQNDFSSKCIRKIVFCCSCQFGQGSSFKRDDKVFEMIVLKLYFLCFCCHQDSFWLF